MCRFSEEISMIPRIFFNRDNCKIKGGKLTNLITNLIILHISPVSSSSKYFIMKPVNNLSSLLAIYLHLFIISQIIFGIVCSNKILIIGANGRVGSMIASNLLEKGISPNLLVRDIEKAKNNSKLEGCNIFQCDISQKNSILQILEASKDCDTIIDVHGVNPPRFIKFKDFFIHPKHNDKNHPYHVNYLGIKSILAAMKINKINKLIRITGALVDKNEFFPFSALFNFLLSKANKWHTLSEKAIREANIDYTVIRPTGIRDTVNTTKLVILPGDSNQIAKVPAQISVQNVASICIQAIADKRLSKSTIVCSTEYGEGSNEWESLISTRESWKDTKVIGKRFYNIAIMSYGILIASSLAIISKTIEKIFRLFFKFITSK